MNKPSPEPPNHLSERSKTLWRAIVPARAKSPERLAMVLVALEALDRADEASAVVAKEGMTSVTKRTGVSHVHPLLRVERESRQLFVKVWGAMNLQWNPHIDGRL